MASSPTSSSLRSRPSVAIDIFPSFFVEDFSSDRLQRILISLEETSSLKGSKCPVKPKAVCLLEAFKEQADEELDTGSLLLANKKCTASVFSAVVRLSHLINNIGVIKKIAAIASVLSADRVQSQNLDLIVDLLNEKRALLREKIQEELTSPPRDSTVVMTLFRNGKYEEAEEACQLLHQLLDHKTPSECLRIKKRLFGAGCSVLSGIRDIKGAEIFLAKFPDDFFRYLFKKCALFDFFYTQKVVFSQFDILLNNILLNGEGRELLEWLLREKADVMNSYFSTHTPILLVFFQKFLFSAHQAALMDVSDVEGLKSCARTAEWDFTNAAAFLSTSPRLREEMVKCIKFILDLLSEMKYTSLLDLSNFIYNFTHVVRLCKIEEEKDFLSEVLSKTYDTIINSLAASGDFRSTIELLNDERVPKSDYLLETVLIIAVSNGDHEMLKALLEYEKIAEFIARQPLDWKEGLMEEAVDHGSPAMALMLSKLIPQDRLNRETLADLGELAYLQGDFDIVRGFGVVVSEETVKLKGLLSEYSLPETQTLNKNHGFFYGGEVTQRMYREYFTRDVIYALWFLKKEDLRPTAPSDLSFEKLFRNMGIKRRYSALKTGTAQASRFGFIQTSEGGGLVTELGMAYAAYAKKVKINFNLGLLKQLPQKVILDSQREEVAIDIPLSFDGKRTQRGIIVPEKNAPNRRSLLLPMTTEVEVNGKREELVLSTICVPLVIKEGKISICDDQDELIHIKHRTVSPEEGTALKTPLMKRSAELLFSAAPSTREELMLRIAEIHGLIAQGTIYRRGTASIGQELADALWLRYGIVPPKKEPGINWDLEYLTHPIFKSVMRQYPG